MKLKSMLLTGVFSALLLSACNSGGSTSTPGNNDLGGIGTPFQQTVAYVDLTATNLNKIPDTAYPKYNMMIYAFANPNTSSIDQKFLTSMQKIINLEAPGTVNLLSLGGQYATINTFNKNTVNTILTNILAQIDSYNAKLTNGKINGVDLDLENGIDADTIYTLAAGFKAHGLKVSIAPQAFLSSGTNVPYNNDSHPTAPTNLVLTSGWSSAADTLHQNVYGKTIVNYMADYIIVQPYNTPGWTIGAEHLHSWIDPTHADEGTNYFLQNLIQILGANTLPTCNKNASSTDPLCIPPGIPLIIAQPANYGAASYSAFNQGPGKTPRSQYNVLTYMGNDEQDLVNPYGIHSILSSGAQNNDFSDRALTPTRQTLITGVAVWSLNNDYDPAAYGAKNIEANGYTQPGMFSCSFVHAPMMFLYQGSTYPARETNCPSGIPGNGW